MKKFVVFIFLLTAQTSFAQGRPFYSFSLGGGAIWKQNIRDDNQYDKANESTQFSAIPMAQIKVGPLSITGPNLKLQLPKYKMISSYMTVKRSGEKYYGPGMDRRKDSWFTEIGARLMMFKISYARDTQGRSHGEVLDVSVGGRNVLGPVMLMYTISHTFFDKEFSNYYYGVRNHEATLTRSTYTPGSTGSTSLSMVPIWLISENWSLFNSVKFTYLGKKIRKSPTVAKDSFLMMISGLSYKF